MRPVSSLSRVRASCCARAAWAASARSRARLPFRRRRTGPGPPAAALRRPAPRDGPRPARRPGPRLAPRPTRTSALQAAARLASSAGGAPRPTSRSRAACRARRACAPSAWAAPSASRADWASPPRGVESGRRRPDGGVQLPAGPQRRRDLRQRVCRPTPAAPSPAASSAGAVAGPGELGHGGQVRLGQRPGQQGGERGQVPRRAGRPAPRQAGGGLRLRRRGGGGALAGGSRPPRRPDRGAPARLLDGHRVQGSGRVATAGRRPGRAARPPGACAGRRRGASGGPRRARSWRARRAASAASSAASAAFPLRARPASACCLRGGLGRGELAELAEVALGPLEQAEPDGGVGGGPGLTVGLLRGVEPLAGLDAAAAAVRSRSSSWLTPVGDRRRRPGWRARRSGRVPPGRRLRPPGRPRPGPLRSCSRPASVPATASSARRETSASRSVSRWTRRQPGRALASLLAALAGELQRCPLRAAGQRLPGRGVGFGGLPFGRAGLLQRRPGRPASRVSRTAVPSGTRIAASVARSRSSRSSSSVAPARSRCAASISGRASFTRSFSTSRAFSAAWAASSASGVASAKVARVSPRASARCPAALARWFARVIICW